MTAEPNVRTGGQIDEQVRIDLTLFITWLRSHAQPQGIKWRLDDRLIKTNYAYGEARITIWFDGEKEPFILSMRGQPGDLDTAIAVSTPL
jgi:hypothetical protein